MIKLFLAILLVLWFNSNVNATDSDMERGIADFVNDFIDTISDSKPITFEKEELFLGEGKEGLGISLSYFLLQPLGYLDKAGLWLKPMPKISYIGELLRSNKNLFHVPGGKRRIMVVPSEAKTNTFNAIVLVAPSFPDEIAHFSPGIVNKVIVFEVILYGDGQRRISLISSTINGEGLPYLLGFDKKIIEKTVAGNVQGFDMPYLPENQLKELAAKVARSDEPIQLAAKEKWRFKTGGRIGGKPVIHGEIIYFGSADGNFYAIRHDSGEEAWRFNAGSNVYSPASDGTRIFFGSFDGALYALNINNGKKVWEFNTGGSVFYWPTLANGMVYVVSKGDIYALDAESGALIWKYSSGRTIQFACLFKGGVLYFVSRDNYLYAVNSITGEELWRKSFSRDISRNTLISNLIGGNLYLGGEDGHLYAVDLEKKNIAWKFKTGRGVISLPQYHDGNIFFGSNDASLYSLDIASGRLNWWFETGDQITCSPNIVDGLVYFGSWDSHLYVLDAKTGQERIRLNIGSKIMSSPVVHNEIVFFGAENGTFHAIKIE